MPVARTTLQRPLSRRLLPLVYALAAVIGLILLLTWGAMQVQVTLAGFLNGESVWSKAQKQAVVDLGSYAGNNTPEDLAAKLADFRLNYAVLASDRFARDSIASGHFDHDEVTKAFRQGNVIPEAIPGMIFMLDYFSSAPYMNDALEAWRSTDAKLTELGQIADELQRSHAQGHMERDEIIRQRSRISAVNDYIEPRSKLFSLEIAKGAVWLGRVLFIAVFLTACLASLLWLRMALRILTSIRGTEERYSLLFDSAADAIVMVDEASGRILDVNHTMKAWSGDGKTTLIGERFADLFVSSPAHEGIGTLRGPYDTIRPVEMQSSLVSWGEQSVRQAIIRDITERVSLDQTRRIAAQALASIAEGVIIADAERRVIRVNAAHNEITGFCEQDLEGRHFDETRSMPNGEPLPASVWQTIATSGNWLGEVQSLHRDGSIYPERLSISAIRDESGQLQHYVAVFTNITTAKASQQRLEYLAAHDPLTDLVNRAEFERLCERAIAAAAHDHQTLAVLFVDLDAFKVVNDSYSHAIGDRLLVKVAERIKRELSANDLAGRIGGDEFTILVGGLQAREQASALTHRLLAALAEPVMIGDYELVLSASIGIAGYPLDGQDATMLIANADAAMYVAKTEERNAFRFYTPMMQADARRRLALAAELRQALEGNEFRQVYQPSVELRSGRIIAVEALLRWDHPERGMVQPAEFIPLAERLGLIRRIDEWVLRAACAQMHHWDTIGMPSVRMAVNVSAGWFGHPSFVEDIRTTLESWHIAPHRLLLEITEGVILRLGEDMEHTMRELHALGVGVAIDDFGTGYSAMSYLKLPAIACLKIDQSFVMGLPGDANDAAIVEAMLTLSRNLGLYAIAEGIENEAQHDFLVRAGCQEGQGFLYSHPLSGVDVERLLRRHPSHGPTKLQLVPPRG